MTYSLKKYNNVLLCGFFIGTIRHYEDTDEYKFRLFNVKSIFHINPEKWNARKISRPFYYQDKYESTIIYFGKIPLLTIQYREAPARWLNPKRDIRCLLPFKRNNLKRKRIAIIKQKSTIGEALNVVFFVSRLGCWLWEGLYKLFAEDTRFHVTVCVVPWAYNGNYEMRTHMQITYQYLLENGYNVIASYNAKTKEFYDVKQLKPDIIFHDKSWYKHVPAQYYMTNFDDTLNYLVEYGISGASNPDGHFNLLAHHLADAFFVPTQIHYEMCKHISKNKGKNAVFLGYPKLDSFFDKTYKAKDVWKPQAVPKKKIIWAPHFLFFSSDLYKTGIFNLLFDIMLDIAKKYENSVQFAFKPHPMLQAALYSKPMNGGPAWGREKTDAYYKKWEELPNGQLEEGAITDLFITSDAMILDSISFIAEYSATNKPALFTISGSESKLNFDEFGQKAFDILYKTETSDFLRQEIEHFIDDVVLNGNDSKRDAREQFIQNVLIPPNDKTASQNIYDYVIKSIGAT